MASKTTLLPRSGRHCLLLRHTRHSTPRFFCTACVNATSLHRPRTQARARLDAVPRRCLSTTTTTTPAQNPRAELEKTLLELQKHSPNLISLSRLQLALQGLRQETGSEVVRIAILGVVNGSGARSTARRVLRALLADPLGEEQPWERELEGVAGDGAKSLVVRVGPPRQHAVSLEIERETGLDEMHISSPPLDGLNLEFLLMEVDIAAGAFGTASVKALEDAVLVPAVDMSSATGSRSPVPTPVHQALLVADGLPGAVKISALPLAETDEPIAAAVQLEGFSGSQLVEGAIDVIDVSLAEQGVRLFRQGPQHGMDYERLWFASNVPLLANWLKTEASSAAGDTKPALRKLIASILRHTLSEVQLLETRALSQASVPRSTDPNSETLNDRLADWARDAHAELQGELDLAFGGRRWRKLGWWKLFWRVDDVAMLTNEMLARRFMPTAEQELVYLAGRIAQWRGSSAAYPQPAPSRDDASSKGAAPVTTPAIPSALPKWPGHIAFTRRYLQNETVPALQSLAQRLILQSLGTSGAATSLAALLYMSSLASSVYEAGAVAALGIVFSLGRVQRKWDAARSFWEGEVREEGRKAVRAAEESVAVVLEGGAAGKTSIEGAECLEETRKLVARAEDALARMK